VLKAQSRRKAGPELERESEEEKEREALILKLAGKWIGVRENKNSF
jgi:hypothetical protein